MTTLAEQLLRGDLPAPLTLVEFEHQDLARPLRLVNDDEDFMHDGHTWHRARFAAVRPAQQQQQQPTAVLSFARLDTIVDVIDRTAGAAGATVNLLEVARAEPGVVQASLRGLEVAGAAVDMRSIRISLGLPNTLNRPAVRQRFEPRTAPALFDS